MELDPIIHQPVRLKLMASLVSIPHGDSVDFIYLRQVLQLTDGNLGAHLLKLEESGYAEVDKTFVGRKPRSFIHATDKGRAAFRDYVKVLEGVIYSEGIPGDLSGKTSGPEQGALDSAGA
jgi:DNA-binding MarR family transcriptional regulator